MLTSAGLHEIDEVPVPIVVIDGDLGAVEVNAAWTALTGLAADDSVRDGWMTAFSTADRSQIREAIEHAAAGSSVAAEWRLTTSVPRTVAARVQRAADGSCVLTLFDVTDWATREADLVERATRDPLTGLHNRAVLADRTQLALQRFARSGHPPTLLYLDLDGFKAVNDALGHHVGDQVLLVVAERMQAVSRPTDTFARVGGDEFVMLSEDLVGAGATHGLVSRLKAAAAQPIAIATGTVRVAVSVGVAVAETEADTLDTLLARADRALYEAKRGAVVGASESLAGRSWGRPGSDQDRDQDQDQARTALDQAVGALGRFLQTPADGLDLIDGAVRNLAEAVLALHEMRVDDHPSSGGSRTSPDGPGRRSASRSRRAPAADDAGGGSG